MNSRRDHFFLVIYLVALSVASAMLANAAVVSGVLFTCGIYVMSVGVIWRTALTTSELGIRYRYVRSGIKQALPYVMFIGIGSALIFLVDASLFRDLRYQQNLAGMLFMILVAIPFKTVLVEELVFRGVLLALANRTMTQPYALVSSSVAFGLWHAFSARAIQNPYPVRAFGLDAASVTVIGVVFATFCAGMFFGWQRIRSRSLWAPIIVHWAINSTGVVLAYLAWR